MPTEKKPEPMTDMMQWTLGHGDPPNQKRQIGLQKGVPTKAGGKRFLRFDLALLVKLHLDHPVGVIEEKGGHDEDGAEEDAHERATFLANVRLTSSHTID